MRVLIHTVGGSSVGLGHAIRSIALAEEAVASGQQVTLAGTFGSGLLRRRIEAARLEVVDLPRRERVSDALSELVSSGDVDVLHVDRYDLPDELVDVAASRTVLLSNVEDGRFGRRRADLTVDPTLGAETDARPAPHGVWLRGVRFAPLRRQVLEQRGRMRVKADARRALVMMGGTDARGLTPRAIGLLAATGLPLEVTAIVPAGTTPPASRSPLEVRVIPPVDDIAALMVEQDLVISAAGTSVTELLCLGVPAALVCAVENQRQGYSRVVEAGAALGLGDGADHSEAVTLLRRAVTEVDLRRSLAKAATGLVDGLGSWRVVRAWEQLASGPRPAPPATGLPLRTATTGDAELLMGWRNDPATRAASRSSDAVSLEEHRRWLAESLERDDRILLVGSDPHGPVGTVRWDRVAPHDWEVSITVAPERRGQGQARRLLLSGEAELRRRAPSAVTLLATVRQDNVASRRLFESAGYTPDLPADEKGLLRLLRQPSWSRPGEGT